MTNQSPTTTLQTTCCNNTTITMATCCNNTTAQLANLTVLQCCNTTTTAPSINNTNTKDNNDYCPPYLALYMTFFVLIIFLVVVGNLFILAVMNPFKKQQRRPNIELLIFYLAIFDLIGSVIIVVDVYDNITCFKSWVFGWFACKTVYASFDISLNMSVCILTIMSVDRCRSITTPLKRKFSQRLIHLAVLISLALSTAQQWYQFTGWQMKNGMCYVDRRNPMFLIPRVVTTIARDTIFVVVFTVTSCLVYTSLAHSNLLDVNFERKKTEINKVVTMLIIMEAMFALLVIPYDVYFNIMAISMLIPGDHAIEFTDTVYHVDRALSVLQMSNCFANCFIYAKMHRLFAHRALRTTTGSSTVVESTKGSRRNTQETLPNPAQLFVTSM